MPYRSAFFHLAFFLLCLLLGPCTSRAQECRLHQECPAGTLCDGTCKPFQDVLTSDGGTLFWIDAQNGDDSNDGSQNRPWKTIARAMTPGVLHAGDAVVLRAGTYREEIRPRTGGSASAFLTFAAYPGEDVIISGADVINTPGQHYSGWEQQPDGTWRHAWTWRAQPAEGVYASARRRELLVDNGRVLMQQGGQARPSLQKGEFWVEGTDSNPMAVYVQTFDGTNPNQHTMEVGQRDRLFYSAGEGSHQCGTVDQGYYRLIGLAFVHGTSKRQRMVVCPGRYGSLLEGVNTSWNNGGGIKLVGRGHVVRGATANHNGIEGIGGTNCDGCIVEDSEIRGNNWKGGPARGHGGGGKFTRSRRSIFRNNVYAENNGAGLWLDLNNHDNEIYSNRVDRNTPVGIFIEHGSSRNRIYNNVVTRTRYSDVRKNTIGIGISISTSDSNLVAYNTVMNSDGAGLKISGDNRRDATGNLIYNNLFIANTQRKQGQSHEVLVIGNGQKLPDNNTLERRWSRVVSNRFNGNAYWPHAGEARSKKNRTIFMLAPGGRQTDKTLYTDHFSEWQQTGADAHGLVTDPARPTITNPEDPISGWRLAPGSQYNGRAVSLPPGVAPILTDFFGTPRPPSGGTVGAHQQAR